MFSKISLASLALVITLTGCSDETSKLIISANDYCGINGPVAGSDFDRKTELKPWGWAFDLSTGKIPEKIVMQIISDDNKNGITSVLTRSSRPDVAKSFGKPEVDRAGFEGKIDVSTLAAGAYQISVVQYSPDRIYICKGPSKIVLK